jgi:hypothetical protein
MRRVLFCAVVVALLCGSARAAEPAPPPHEPGAAKPLRYTARVTSDDKGTIANITLRGEGLPDDGLDFKTDVDAFAKKLATIADSGMPVALQMEIADKLLQAEVVRLFEKSLRAGLKDFSPVPIDPSKR